MSKMQARTGGRLCGCIVSSLDMYNDVARTGIGINGRTSWLAEP